MVKSVSTKLCLVFVVSVIEYLLAHRHGDPVRLGQVAVVAYGLRVHVSQITITVEQSQYVSK
jgi:hypothetical protein